MRISLLMKREAFGEIIEATLPPFLSWLSGQPQNVRWRPVGADAGTTRQTWLCNPYLNAIFTPSADPGLLRPMKLEYGRSLSFGRRLAQRLYVEAGTRRPARKWLATASMQVSPGLAQAKEMVIMGGNHSLRLLWPRRGLSYVIAKQGFPMRFWQADMSLRSSGELADMPVSSLLEADPLNRWYCEKYIQGVPQNRLNDSHSRQKALQDALPFLRRLAKRTLKPSGLQDYCSSVLKDLRRMAANLPAGEAGLIRDVLNNAGLLAQRAIDLWPGGTVYTCTTHGDFQPANLLWDNGRIWLIDWEYSARRHTGFDLFTWALAARSGRDIRPHLINLMEGGQVREGLPWESWPGLGWAGQRERAASASLFLLAELALRVAESAGFPFQKVEGGLLRLLAQLPQLRKLLRSR